MRILLSLLLLSSFCANVCADPPEPEAEWGNFTGQLIYDGEPPVRKPYTPRNSKFAILDESLVVNPKTRGIANVFVYLRTEQNPDQSLPVHPSYQQQIKKPVTWHGSPTGYSPHVMLLHTEQQLSFSTDGKVVISPKMQLFQNTPFGDLIPPGKPRVYQFSKTERLPSPVGCNIHAWLSGYLLVRDNPYMAVTDKDGMFNIKDLPVGEHEFQFWQEKTGYIELPVTQSREAELAGVHKKGRLQLLIQPGENDLGKIKFDPRVFE